MNGRIPETEIHQIEYQYEFWEFILNRILIFIDYFNRFMESSDMKEKLLIDGIEEYKMKLF